MISNISKALEDGQFLSDVYLSLDGIKINNDDLELTIQVTYENNDEVLQLWKVTCTDFREHQLNVHYFEEFKVLDDHVYLWKYNNPLADLFFKGVCYDINQVVRELYINHSNKVKGQLPMEKYLNLTGDLVDLLQQGEGLFSKGPLNIIKVHEKVLSNNGFKTTVIDYSNTESGPFKLLMFEDSFVVAKSFKAKQVF
ncbi:hypothetical protein [Niallia sp. BSM11]|uniref:hypothetical protein n=1 Tax=Niallia sp. BSM11 TaxID=3391576 RepID=UPI0039851909